MKFIVNIAIFLFLVWFVTRHAAMTWQTSSSGKLYYVKRAPGQDLVADRLDLLTARLNQLLEQADDAYPGDIRIANVRARWNGTLGEVSEKDDIAYSMNKQEVHVCVRNPANGQLESENTSMYVLLHEIAHVATDTYGHPPEFWLNFRWFLEVADSLGLYEYEDFDTKETTFCGHTLGNNVLRCRKRGECDSLLEKKSGGNK
jgi:hypothetical protein